MRSTWDIRYAFGHYFATPQRDSEFQLDKRKKDPLWKCRATSTVSVHGLYLWPGLDSDSYKIEYHPKRAQRSPGSQRSVQLRYWCLHKDQHLGRTNKEARTDPLKVRNEASPFKQFTIVQTISRTWFYRTVVDPIFTSFRNVESWFVMRQAIIWLGKLRYLVREGTQSRLLPTKIFRSTSHP